MSRPRRLAVAAAVLGAALCSARAGERARPAPAPRPAQEAATPSPEYPALEAVEREVARLVDSARPSVVGVIARSPLEPLLDALGDDVKIEGNTRGAGPLARRLGSGVVLDADGHIVTLSSIVSDATEVLVLTSAGEKLHARVKGTDDYSGIAVLELDQSATVRELIPVTFGDSETLRTGALVTAFSSPFGSPGSAPVYSFGFVSGTGVSQGPGRRCSYIRFNAYAPPGAGGGPVLDSKGRFVGLLFGAGSRSRGGADDLIKWDRAPAPGGDSEWSVVHPPSGAGEDPSIWILKSLKRQGAAEGGVAYAVPSNLVRRVSEQIVSTGAVRRGWVGLKIEESEPGEIHLIGLVPGGPAEKAGLRTGDRIVAFNGEALAGSAPLVDGISSTAPGTAVTLGVERDGRRLDVAITLGASREAAPRPPHPAAPPAPMRLRPPVLGVELDVDTDDELRARLGAPEGVGLLVQKVYDASRAARAGMLAGDLLLDALGEPIHDLDDLRRALRRQGAREMEIKVVRDGRSIVLRIPPQREPPPPPAPPSRGPRR